MSVVCVAATLWARAALGADAADEAVARFGYGLPAFEAGRPWTVFTGFPLESSLSMVPQPITVVALVACEWLALHWRTLVVFVGGHVVAVLVVAGVLWLVRDPADDWLWAMAHTLDVGSSNGAFACLGAWTAFLRAPTRRRLRLGISCYLLMALLISGHVYDLSHPVGWITGLAVGQALTRGSRRPYDSSPRQARELPWLALVAAVGLAYGVYDAWNPGGTGGPFGWGPGSPG
ncbi:MAG: hypothetical protein ABW219_02990 [Ilumatobacteraceae bacterium]